MRDAGKRINVSHLIEVTALALAIPFVFSIIELTGARGEVLSANLHLGSTALSVAAIVVWIRWRMGIRLSEVAFASNAVSRGWGLGIGSFAGFALYLGFWMFEPDHASPVETEYSTLQVLSAPFLARRGISGVLLAPVSEELLFRGLYYPFFRDRLGIGGALIVQACLATAFHFPVGESAAPLSIARLFISSVAMGVAFQATGRLETSWACHAMFNYLAIVTRYIPRS